MTVSARPDTPRVRSPSAGFQLPPELEVANALVGRWADQTGNRPPIAVNAIARAMAEAEGAALPGGVVMLDDKVMLVDCVIARGAVRTKHVIEVHYRSWAPAEIKAHRLAHLLGLPSMCRATFYSELKFALWYVRGALSQRGLDMDTV